MKRYARACAGVLLGIVAAAPALAQGKVSVTEAQLLSTVNGAGQDEPYWVLTLQHFSLWKYGTNFFFLDVADQGGLADPFEERPGLYLEYAPVLSLGGLGVLQPGGGVLRDVGVTAQLNVGWTSGDPSFPIDRVFLEGVELVWTVPGFAVFNTQLLARQEQGHDPSWQVTWVYALPFAAGPADGVLTGFLDVWRRSPEQGDDDYTVLLAQPQLLFDLASPELGASFLQLGVELEPSRNFPLRAVNDGWNVAVSPMLRWVF